MGSVFEKSPRVYNNQSCLAPWKVFFYVFLNFSMFEKLQKSSWMAVEKSPFQNNVWNVVKSEKFVEVCYCL